MFFIWLKKCNQCATPLRSRIRQEFRCSCKTSHMHIVTAKMRDRLLLTPPIFHILLTCPGQLGLLFDWKSVKFGSKHHSLAWPVVQYTNHTMTADVLVDVGSETS